MSTRNVKNSASRYGLKLIVPALFLVAIGMTVHAYGQGALEFGYKLHPEKPLENTEAILQIYVLSGESPIPKEITDLKVTSSDSKIVQILGIEQANQYTTNVKIKTLTEGTANIAIAAPGFSSREIPVEVFTNNNNPTKLLLKTTPNDFAVDSPKFGYITVELLTSGGLPTKATADTTVKLLSPNSDLLELTDESLVIPKGKYFAIGQFKIKDYGDAILFAETEGMKKVSSRVHVRAPLEPLTLKMYVYPGNYLSLTNNMGYVIIQLEDTAGFPVKATHDIRIGITVDNPEATVNTSGDIEEVVFDKKDLVIKEGKYSTYTTFTPRPTFTDLVDTTESSTESSTQTVSKRFNFGISAEGYAASGGSITVTHSGSGVGELNGNGPAKIGSVPFLTTGEREIIGVAYLETSVEAMVEQADGSQAREDFTVPVMSLGNFAMKMTSSDLETVSVIEPTFPKGKNAVLLFGNTGTIIPIEDTTLTYEDNEGIKITSATPKGHFKDDLSLVVDSLIDEILVDEEFPALAYMKASTSDDEDADAAPTAEGEEEEEDGREGPTRFASDAMIVFEADDIVDVEPQLVKQNQPYQLFYAKAKKVGSTTLSGSGGDFDASLSITSETTDPTEIQLTHIDTALSGTESTVTIQLLDSAQNPVFVKNDVEIKLVTDRNGIVEIPNSIIIKSGEYFATFTIKAIGEGQVEISTLAENFPLEKFQIKVDSIQPVLTLTAPDFILANEDFNGELGMSLGDLGISSANYDVKWDVQGAEVKRADPTTNQDGKARALLKAADSGSVSITATVTGVGLAPVAATKQVTINQTSSEIIDDTPQETGITGISIGGIDMIYLIIPAAAGGAIFFLKKTNRLEGILEKIKLDGLIETIKDKIPSRE